MAEKISDIEPDQHPGAPHPRVQSELIGHGDAERAFLEGWRSNRLHHAWLVGGPEGIGKATFAWAATRFLLANPDPAHVDAQAIDSLSVAPDSRVFRQVAAGAHPDVAVIRRGPRKDGKGFSAEIAVADVRRALDVFATTASGWRVVIVDCADDLNLAGANALLKAIEEPPPRSVAFVISHAPARVLPTIRSRCRRLDLRPLTDNEVARTVRTLGPPWDEASDASLAEATALAHGSVGRALDMLDEGRRGLIRQTQGLLHGLPRLDTERLMALAESVAGRDQGEAFHTMLGVVQEWIADIVRSKAGLGPRRLAPLVEVWENSAQAAREAESFNLDRRPLVISMFGDFAQAVRRLSAA